MIKNDKTIYLMNMNNEILDIVYGIEADGNSVRCGLQSHSISFDIEKNIEDGEAFSFMTSNNTMVSLKPLTKEIYDTIKGVVISKNAPTLLTDEDVQECFWLNRGL